MSAPPTSSLRGDSSQRDPDPSTQNARPPLSLSDGGIPRRTRWTPWPVDRLMFPACSLHLVSGPNLAHGSQWISCLVEAVGGFG